MKKMIVVILAVVAIVSAAGVCRAVDRERGVKLNEKAPGFTFPDRYGGKVSLSDFEGKKVLLYFWVSWCVCRDQLPLLEKYREENAGKNFEIVSVSIDAQGLRYVTPIVDIAGVKYPVLLDSAASTAQLYHFPATPAMFLIDEAGVVKRQYLPDFDIANEKTRQEVDAFLAEKPVESKKSETPDIKAQIADLEKQVADKPEDVKTRRRLAGMLSDAGESAAAVTHLEYIVKQKGKTCQDLFSLGTLNDRLGNGELALKNWKAASRCDSLNYIYMRTVQSYENPDQFYAKDKMKELYFGK